MAADVVVELQDEAIATVTLTNVERRNAISMAMWERVAEVFGKLARREKLRAVLLRADPEGRAFSPGADMTEFPEMRGTTEKALEYKERTHAAIERVWCCPVPVVAVIDGPCLGGGFELAMASDLRLATPRSSFGLPVIKLSNTADLTDVRRIMAAAGPSLTAEILLTGGTIPADRAYAAGMVHWLGSPEEIEKAAQETIAKIVAGAPRAVRLAKKGMRFLVDPPAGHHPGEEYANGVRMVLTGKDFQEGTQAFLDRRTPVFTGE